MSLIGSCAELKQHRLPFIVDCVSLDVAESRDFVGFSVRRRWVGLVRVAAGGASMTSSLWPEGFTSLPAGCLEFAHSYGAFFGLAVSLPCETVFHFGRDWSGDAVNHCAVLSTREFVFSGCEVFLWFDVDAADFVEFAVFFGVDAASFECGFVGGDEITAGAVFFDTDGLLVFGWGPDCALLLGCACVGLGWCVFRRWRSTATRTAASRI